MESVADDPCKSDEPCPAHTENRRFDESRDFQGLSSYDDIGIVERGFKLNENGFRECKLGVEDGVKEPDPYHPKIRTVLEESNDSQLPPFPPKIPRHPQLDDYGLDTSPLGLPGEKPPCYLPQEDDDHVVVPSAQAQMDPIGPWGTGRVDWSPLAGLTGTRPVVNQYSITRYSTNEWRKRNFNTLENASNAVQRSIVVENDAKNLIMRTHQITERNQCDNTKRLQNRARDIDDFKEALERAIRAMTDEICTLEEQRRRLKQSLNVLQMPDSIASQCLETRTRRPEAELVRDEPEEELIKEKSLINEIRNLLLQTLADIEAQQARNRNLKQRMEFDWGDKKVAHQNDSNNCHLSNKSTAILFKQGATRFSNDQSTEISWEEYTRNTLDEAEKCRQSSIQLRGTLDAILLNAARDLRTQADTIDRALHNRIICMDEMRQRLEIELKTCLRRIADTEIQIEKLKQAISNKDFPMKVSQSRLDNRLQRPRVENCRDVSQFALMGEVKSIHDSITALNEQLQTAELMKRDLMINRGDLEREIMLKRRAINIDRDRIQLFRSHFPSATALSGY